MLIKRIKSQTSCVRHHQEAKQEVEINLANHDTCNEIPRPIQKYEDFVIHVAFLLKYDMITKLSRLNLANISINFSLTNVY